jgi:hypothetical protein
MGEKMTKDKSKSIGRLLFGLGIFLIIIAGCRNTEIFIEPGFYEAGCATVTTKANKSIVGVWEMKEVRIAKMSQAPPVELTNKKDIYTKEGIYHDTAADSIKMTDATVRSYKFKNGNLNIYGENGQEQKSRRAKVRFIPPNKMELKTPDGIIIIFQKISDDPSEIPKLKEHIVPVKMQ